jgi:hypothetical protein
MSASGNVALWALIGITTVVGISWGAWTLSRKIFDKKMESVQETKEPQLD